jgi:hypothetical protein
VAPTKDNDGEPRWLLAMTLRHQIALILEEVQGELTSEQQRAWSLLADAIALLDKQEPSR